MHDRSLLAAMPHWQQAETGGAVQPIVAALTKAIGGMIGYAHAPDSQASHWADPDLTAAFHRAVLAWWLKHPDIGAAWEQSGDLVKKGAIPSDLVDPATGNTLTDLDVYKAQVAPKIAGEWEPSGKPADVAMILPASYVWAEYEPIFVAWLHKNRAALIAAGVNPEWFTPASGAGAGAGAAQLIGDLAESAPPMAEPPQWRWAIIGLAAVLAVAVIPRILR